MRTAFIRTCWMPTALWIATLVYLRPYDGWGAWAAAPLLLPSLAMSIVWGLWGVALVVRSGLRSRVIDRAIVIATVVAGSEFLYYWVRYLLRPTDYSG